MIVSHHLLSVALVTLYADSLHAVVPVYSSNTYKIIGLAVYVLTQCTFIREINSIS